MLLPFESTIKNYISSKLQQDKNGNTGTGGRCRADFVLPDDVTEFLKTSLYGNINAKPKDLTATLIEGVEIYIQKL